MMERLKTGTDNFLHANPTLYDAFESDGEHRMARFLHRLLTQYCAGKSVLDVGCGLGREVGYLNENGYSAIGLDSSLEMIGWASEHYPLSRFVLGQQSTFSLDTTFDAIVCVGSVFLYNYTNDAAASTLRNFHRHLAEGGVLYMDMRNAAFFLTADGQRWLTEELIDHTTFEGMPATVKTRFTISRSSQILERTYNWVIGEDAPVIERLKHRLFFPQEMVMLLESCGFEVLQLFDVPEPHIGGGDEDSGDIVFVSELSGRRMQVIAKASPAERRESHDTN